jgi:hypothetical protein
MLFTTGTSANNLYNLVVTGNTQSVVDNALAQAREAWYKFGVTIQNLHASEAIRVQTCGITAVVNNCLKIVAGSSVTFIDNDLQKISLIAGASNTSCICFLTKIQ